MAKLCIVFSFCKVSFGKPYSWHYCAWLNVKKLCLVFSFCYASFGKPYSWHYCAWLNVTKLCIVFSFCYVSFRKPYSWHYYAWLNVTNPWAYHIQSSTVVLWICFHVSACSLISYFLTRTYLFYMWKSLSWTRIYYILTVNGFHALLCHRSYTARLWTPPYCFHITWGHHTSNRSSVCAASYWERLFKKIVSNSQ